jgi:chorismate mutase
MSARRLGPGATIATLRHRIEAVDRRLIDLYADRRRLVEALWEYKHGKGLPLEDPRQEARIVARARDWAVARGLPPDEAERFIRGVVGECKRAMLTLFPSPLSLHSTTEA